MQKRGVNNLALARAVNVSHVAIGNFVSGQLPKSEHLVALAEFFEVSTDELLGRCAVKYPDHVPTALVLHDAPKKPNVSQLEKIATSLEIQIGELRRAIAELKK